MLRTRILAAGLTMLAGSFAATASAEECQKHFLWMCMQGGASEEAAERPMQIESAARPGGRRHHSGHRRHGHRYARHHFHQRSPHVLAQEAEPAASRPPEAIQSEQVVVATIVPGMNWAGEGNDQTGSVGAALATPRSGGPDFLTLWQDTVGPIGTATFWPAQTLNSFTDFPPP